MLAIDHPNIVKVHEIIEDSCHFCIITEILDSQISIETCENEEHGKLIIKQVLEAINYLDSIGIIHKDIKLENIMFTDASKIKIKLIDFGFATFVSKINYELTLGSPFFMAPEMIKALKYDQKVDVWAIGILAYCLLCKSYPFADSDL